PTATGPVSGSVHDTSGAAIPGATVMVIGHAELQAPTDGAGNYTLTVPAGIYTLLASAPGYEPAQIPNVTTGAGGVNAVLAGDWAALSGGAQLISASPPDLTRFACGGEPKGAFDLSRVTGWLSTSSTTTSTAGPGGPKAIVVQLPAVINVTS